MILESIHQQILSKDGICLTCGLKKTICKKIQVSNKNRQPLCKSCSECGTTIKKDEKFVNFGLTHFNSIHTVCEGCNRK